MPKDSDQVDKPPSTTPGDELATTEEPPPQAAPTEPQALGYLRSSLGIACLVVVAANLGFPLLNAAVALQILLALVGFSLARVIHRSATSTEWRLPLLIGLAGRMIPTLFVLLLLVAVYGMAGSGLMGAEVRALVAAATASLTVVPFIADAAYGPIEHLWVVALVVQVAVVAPWLLTAGRQRLGPFRRSLLLACAALLAALVRFVALTGAEPTSWVTPVERSWIGAVAVWTSLDAILAGVAMATIPLANLHRRPTTKAVLPALGGLAVLLLAPAIGVPFIDLGVRLPLAVLLVSVFLASEAISTLPAAITGVLTRPGWHQIGARAYGLFLWHIPFAYGFSRTDPFRWQGAVVFTIVLLLSFAAATTIYRSIELPIQLAVQRLAARWYPPEAIIPPALAPDQGKWVHWDDVSLDNLPLPSRRRGQRRVAGRYPLRRSDDSGDTVDRIDLSRTASMPLRPRALRRRQADLDLTTSEDVDRDQSAAAG